MMKPIQIKVEDIYVPVKFRDTLDGDKVEALAENILEQGLQAPISVRQGKDRYVLISGLHRLEASRMLGETAIAAYVVSARKY